MALGPRSRVAALLISGVLVPACAPAASVTEPTETAPPVASPATTSPEVSGTTTTLRPTTTTSLAPREAGTTTPFTGTTTRPADLGAEIRYPEGNGPFPTIVLVHGGGWVGGDPTAMSALAAYLTEQGFLTINTPYKLAEQDASFPAAVDDVACAVRLAQALPESSGSVAVVGHSAGAHLSALVALTGDLYAPDCPYPASGAPDALIGLAGPYDVERLGLLMVPFFGGGPNVEPEAWEAGNPMKLVGDDISFSSLIMFGDRDALVDPSFAVDFHQSLIDAGADSTLELVEGARHMDLRDPDTVGDLIVTWLERER